MANAIKNFHIFWEYFPNIKYTYMHTVVQQRQNVMSDLQGEEGEGDYTVYECPGLASVQTKTKISITS